MHLRTYVWNLKLHEQARVIQVHPRKPELIKVYIAWDLTLDKTGMHMGCSNLNCSWQKKRNKKGGKRKGGEENRMDACMRPYAASTWTRDLDLWFAPFSLCRSHSQNHRAEEASDIESDGLTWASHGPTIHCTSSVYMSHSSPCKLSRNNSGFQMI